MTTSQKIIKNVALVLALALAFNIIISIVSGIAYLFVGLGIFNSMSDFDNTETYSKEFVADIDITDIEIKTSIVGLQIYETSDEFAKVKLKEVTNLPEVNFNDGKLKIVEKDDKKFNIGNDIKPVIEVYIPKTSELKTADIKTAVGKTVIESLNVQNLKLNSGVGEITLNNINAETAEINTGTGATKINNTNISDLKLEAGFGEVKYNGNINNSAKIKNGVGEMTIELLGAAEDYTFKLENGIGETKLNNSPINADSNHGSGETEVEIEGGIGSIKITTK